MIPRSVMVSTRSLPVSSKSLSTVSRAEPVSTVDRYTGDRAGLLAVNIRSTDPADFRAYLAQWPEGAFAMLARNRAG